MLKNCCEVFDYVTDTDPFTSSETGNSFKFNYQLNCDDRCVIHIPACKQCQKQCTGEAKDDFRYSWNNYKSNTRKFDTKDSCMQERLYRYFSSPAHNINIP